MSQSRQLAAIMFTDIQGYSALMQKDEEQAIKIRKRHREIFESTTNKYNGQILTSIMAKSCNTSAMVL